MSFTFGSTSLKLFELFPFRSVAAVELPPPRTDVPSYSCAILRRFVLRQYASGSLLIGGGCFLATSEQKWKRSQGSEDFNLLANARILL